MMLIMDSQITTFYRISFLRNKTLPHCCRSPSLHFSTQNILSFLLYILKHSRSDAMVSHLFGFNMYQILLRLSQSHISSVKINDRIVILVAQMYHSLIILLQGNLCRL